MISAMLKPGILLLAAGQARRFGADKLMAKLADGQPVIAHTLKNLQWLAQKYGLELSVVVRHDNHALMRFLQAEHISFTICPDAIQGMGNSIAHGIRSHQHWRGWFIALADMPLVTQDTLEKIFLQAQQTPDNIVRPIVEIEGNKQPGHPVYFPRNMGFELNKLAGDQGAKKIITQHPDMLKWVSTEDQHILTDIDTEKELQNINRVNSN